MQTVQPYSAYSETVINSKNKVMSTGATAAATSASPASENLANALVAATTASATSVISAATTMVNNDISNSNGADFQQQEQAHSKASSNERKMMAKKRNQVKNACTNCQKACKKCADERPCPRCIKLDLAATCVNSIRKERQRGIKRGPYKRKNKTAINEEEGRPDIQSNKVSPVPIVPVIATSTTEESTLKNDNNTEVNNPIISSASTTNNSSIDYGYPPQLSQYPQGYHSLYYNINLTATTKVEKSEQKDDGSHIMTVPYILPNNYSDYPAPIVVNNKTETATATKLDNSTKHDEENIQSTIVDTAEEMSRKIEQFARLSELCSAALREKEQEKKQKQEISESEGVPVKQEE